MIFQEGPGGCFIPLTASRPIPVPLPADVNSPTSWDDVDFVLADVGVCLFNHYNFFV